MGKCRCVNRAHKHGNYLTLVSHRSYTVQTCFRRNGKTSHSNYVWQSTSV